MPGERSDVALHGGAAANRLSIATVFGRHHLLAELSVVVAVGPAEIVSLVDLEHLLGGRFRALCVVEEPGPVPRELIAAMLHHEQRVPGWIERHGHRVANADAKMRSVGWLLVDAVGAKAPDA